MKILLSPSKTQDFSIEPLIKERTAPTFMEKSHILREVLKSYTKDELGQRLKIKGKILDHAYENYQNGGLSGASIESYTGAVFKQLYLKDYTREQWHYLNNHVWILSAMYGVLRPQDEVEAYRLDMTHGILEEATLYTYWKDTMESFFQGEEQIIDLASTEFSKLVKVPKLTLTFKEKKGNGYKAVSTYAKMARGKMLHYMISNQVHDSTDIKAFSEDGYEFNEELSSEYEYVFTR